MPSCTTTRRILISVNTHNMPMSKKPRRGGARKARGVRRRGGRRGAAVALPKRTTGNFASSTEQFSLAITAGVVNDFTFTLNDLVRTKVMQSLYQYYRITSVEMRFKPQLDTYINGGGVYIPYLYFQYDKSGSLFGTMNANNFEMIGTKAIRLDDKTIVRKWKPSVLTSDAGVGGVSQFKVSPWLPTWNAGQNNVPEHYGSTFYISKMNASDGTTYDVDVVVNVQFRKPQIVPSQGQQPSVNPPRVIQGNTTGVDLSLNPHFVTQT